MGEDGKEVTLVLVGRGRDMIRKVGKMWERRTQLERKPQIAAIKATS